MTPHQVVRRFIDPAIRVRPLVCSPPTDQERLVCRQKRRALFEAQDPVDRHREELIANIEGKLQQKNRRQELLALRWKPA